MLIGRQTVVDWVRVLVGSLTRARRAYIMRRTQRWERPASRRPSHISYSVIGVIVNEAWRQRVRVLGPAVDEESRFDGLAAREHSLRGGGRYAPRVGAALLAVLICASVSAARPQSGATGGNGRRNNGSAANSSTTADEADQGPRVPLPGGVHPLARAQFDRGAVADETPASHLLLVLSRPAERQAALEQFLRDAHTPGSASYHGWITPDQFGARFGAQPEDVQRVSAWLTAHGFAIEAVPSNGELYPLLREHRATAQRVRRRDPHLRRERPNASRERA